MTYNAYLKTIHWKNTRIRLLKKKGVRCKFCEDDKNIHVHHKTYKDENGSILFRERNHRLIPLCAKHHALWHSFYGKRKITPMDYVRGKLLLKLGATDQQMIILCTNRVLGIDFLRNLLVSQTLFPRWGNGAC